MADTETTTTPAETKQAPRLMRGLSTTNNWVPAHERPFSETDGLASILAIPSSLDDVPDQTFIEVVHLTAAAVASGDSLATIAASHLMTAIAEMARRAGDEKEARKYQRLSDMVSQVSLDVTASESIELLGHDSDFDHDPEGMQARMSRCLFELGKAA